MKILHFIYGLHVGGAETFLTNVFEKLDSGEFRFDFAIQDSDITNQSLTKLIRANGSKVYILPKFTKSILGHYFALRRILNENNYDFVHIHMNAAVNPVPLILSSRKYAATKFIMHSHSANSAGGLLGRMLHKFNASVFIKTDSIRLACSEMAGKWMFGKKSFEQIDNAIDVYNFKFNDTFRKSIRNELGISHNTNVIGSVARFVAAKNHKFMIDWFADYCSSHENAVMLLVGEGHLLKTTKELCKEKNINGRVIFTGLRTDIPQLLSAMDCFLFPSFFEGLGFTAVEAEACGLDVVASDRVPEVINLNYHTTFVSLKDPMSVWSEAVDKAIDKSRSTDRSRSPVAGSRFDMDVMISKLEKIYRGS